MTDRDARGNPVHHSKAECSFVLVLWPEPDQRSHEAEWLWRVRCVKCGHEKCFRKVGDVLAFVSDETGLPPPR